MKGENWAVQMAPYSAEWMAVLMGEKTVASTEKTKAVLWTVHWAQPTAVHWVLTLVAC